MNLCHLIFFCAEIHFLLKKNLLYNFMIIIAYSEFVIDTGCSIAVTKSKWKASIEIILKTGRLVGYIHLLSVEKCIFLNIVLKKLFIKIISNEYMETTAESLDFLVLDGSTTRRRPCACVWKTGFNGPHPRNLKMQRYCGSWKKNSMVIVY